MARRLAGRYGAGRMSGKGGQPWTRYFAQEMESRTRDLDLVQYAVYRRLTDRMYCNGGSVDGTLTDLARVCGVSRVAFSKALDYLMKERQLISGSRIGKGRQEAAILSSDEVRDELQRAREARENLVIQRRTAIEARWEKQQKRRKKRAKSQQNAGVLQGDPLKNKRKSHTGRNAESELENPPVVPPSEATGARSAVGRRAPVTSRKPTHLQPVSPYAQNPPLENPDFTGFSGSTSARGLLLAMHRNGTWDGHAKTRPDLIAAFQAETGTSVIEGENIEIRSLDEIAQKGGPEEDNIAEFPTQKKAVN